MSTLKSTSLGIVSCPLILLLLFSLSAAAVMTVFLSTDQICGPSKGGCSHFCNVIGGIGVCTCPQGLVLSQDKRTCVGKNL